MQLEVGAILEGKVTGITNFGVFVELEKGTTGMVHISEISSSFVEDINEFVKVGDVVKVKVMSFTDNGKISLSMRRAVPRPERQERTERPERREHRGGFQGRQPDRRDRPVGGNSSRPQSVPAEKRERPESGSFEDMMARFKQSSDEKFMDLKRKNGETKRNRRAPRQ